MKIWVDADACPRAVREILFRAARNRAVDVVLVANQALNVPPSPRIRGIQVAGGFDVADDYIVEHLEAGDLVITADIPLAAQVVDKDAEALNPRGERYTAENIRQRLAMRDLMESLRSSGQVSGGPAALGRQDIQQFANKLDRWLTKHAQ